MSRIILARHGRPAWDFRTPIPGHGFTAWLQGEGDAPLDPSSSPGALLEQLVGDAKCLIASPLRRSQDSARLVSAAVPAVDADVREAALPSAFRSGLRLPPHLWGALARTAWFCGWSAGVESYRSARQRAARAARMLCASADRGGDGDVVVIGHGLMNALIAAQLRSLGWAGPWFPSRAHWAFGSYSRRAT